MMDSACLLWPTKQIMLSTEQAPWLRPETCPPGHREQTSRLRSWSRARLEPLWKSFIFSGGESEPPGHGSPWISTGSETRSECLAIHLQPLGRCTQPTRQRFLAPGCSGSLVYIAQSEIPSPLGLWWRQVLFLTFMGDFDCVVRVEDH